MDDTKSTNRHAVEAPWTSEQVELLRQYQLYLVAHPYTCAGCPTVLEPTTSGWACPRCGYTQNWCAARTLDPDYLASLRRFWSEISLE